VRAADRLQEESVAAAEETKLRAETAAKRQLDQAAQEIARLSALQSDVRSELGRLAQMLSNELASSRHSAPSRPGSTGGEMKTGTPNGDGKPSESGSTRTAGAGAR
jgi:hypothetical protein